MTADISGNNSQSSLQSASEEPPSEFFILIGFFFSERVGVVFLRAFSALLYPFFQLFHLNHNFFQGLFLFQMLKVGVLVKIYKKTSSVWLF